MNEYFDTRIPIVFNDEVEKTEITNTDPDYIITKARVSLEDIRTIYQSIYQNEENVVKIEYKDGDSTTILDHYERVVDLHNKYIAGLKNNILIKAQ